MFCFFVAKIDPSSENMQMLGIVIPFHYLLSNFHQLLIQVNWEINTKSQPDIPQINKETKSLGNSPFFREVQWVIP